MNTIRARLGLTTMRRLWTIIFLGVFTLGAIVLECIAGLWHPAGWTIPWTEYIARYVPWPVQLAAYVILAVWLPLHFWRHDHLRKVSYQAGYARGRLAARADYEKVHARVTACVEPHLGLATTRRLIAELKARGECEMDDRNAGGFLREHMETLLAELPADMLGYSTVAGYPPGRQPGPPIELSSGGS